MLMIDNFRAVRRSNNLHPSVQAITSKIVAGDHSKDRFRTPAEVAAADDTQSSGAGAGTSAPPNKPPRKRSFKQWFGSLSGKQKAWLTTAAAIVVAGLVVGAYFLFFSGSEIVPKVVQQLQQPEEPPKPTTVASNLTGLQVKPEVNDRPVTAIMIENSMDARPQSGLHEAGVVFEAVAEGGITRFLTLFQDNEPDYVGPVRSVRPYYLSWLLGFDAAVAHAGGSARALKLIQQWRVKDLNHHASYFWRVNNRYAPHNLYTSVKKLRKYESQKGFGKALYTPLPRKEKEAPATTVTAKTIKFNISSANFNTSYSYNPETNSYDRSIAGTPHRDEKSGTRLSPKVVIALIMPQGKEGIYTTYSTFGTGTVYIFQNGTVEVGKWRKNSNNENFVFSNAAGDKIRLNPGQTWFTALGASNRVSYTP